MDGIRGQQLTMFHAERPRTRRRRNSHRFWEIQGRDQDIRFFLLQITGEPRQSAEEMGFGDMCHTRPKTRHLVPNLAGTSTNCGPSVHSCPPPGQRMDYIKKMPSFAGHYRIHTLAWIRQAMGKIKHGIFSTIAALHGADENGDSPGVKIGGGFIQGLFRFVL
jgi:hypothetical protein